MMKNGNSVIPWYNQWPQNAWLGEYHMIALLPDKYESIHFKNADQLLIGNCNDAWHLLHPLGSGKC